jgi:hypothetical protein
MNKIYFLILLLIVSFTSCIKDPALNPECDILSFSFNPRYQIGSTSITNNIVTAYPRWDVPTLRDSAFTITVTPGAVYEKIAYDKEDSDILFYIKVISESKVYSKTYPIIEIRKFPELFRLDEWKLYSSRYENPVDGGIAWKSGNNGLSIIYSNKKPDEFPTRRTTDCVAGAYAAELVTMVGPGNVLIQNIPCVAGSMFLGEFNLNIGNPLLSTRFGIPFIDGKPKTFKGYYKYKEGTENYINKDGTTDPGKRDYCSVYAIVYKVDAQTPYLTGINVNNSSNIVAKASINDKSSTPGDEFVYFEIPFDYDSYSTKFNLSDIENYRISIVVSSSENGAYYEGRPGSRLVVDELQLEFENIVSE